jgi:hypothetical protein
MMKWFLTLLIVLVILAVATPWIGKLARSRFRAGHLPGDFRVPVRGRMYYVPVTSTLLFCALMWLVGKVL